MFSDMYRHQKNYLPGFFLRKLLKDLLYQNKEINQEREGMGSRKQKSKWCFQNDGKGRDQESNTIVRLENEAGKQGNSRSMYARIKRN